MAENNREVQLDNIIGNVSARILVDLQSTLDNVRDTSDLDLKTRRMLAYSRWAKLHLLKLLAISNWLNADRDPFEVVNRLKNVVDTRTSNFDAGLHHLHMVHGNLYQKRSRVYEIKTALDILIRETYGQLPGEIRYCGKPQPRKTLPKEKLLRDLSIFIRSKLLLSEKIPMEYANYYTIDNGCLIFRVPHRFELSLTLAYCDEEAEWLPNGCKLLVDTNIDDDFAGTYDYFNYDLEMSAILQKYTKLPEDLQTIMYRSVDPTKVSNDKPITLHNYLQLCEHAANAISLRFLYLEAVQYSKVLRKGQIEVEFLSFPDKQYVAIRFWPGTVSKLYQYELRIVHMRKSTSYHIDDNFFCEIWTINKRNVNDAFEYSQCFEDLSSHVPLSLFVKDGVSFGKLWGEVLNIIGNLRVQVFYQKLLVSSELRAYMSKGMTCNCDFGEVVLGWLDSPYKLVFQVNRFSGKICVNGSSLSEIRIEMSEYLDKFLSEVNDVESEFALTAALNNEDFIQMSLPENDDDHDDNDNNDNQNSTKKEPVSIADNKYLLLVGDIRRLAKANKNRSQKGSNEHLSVQSSNLSSRFASNVSFASLHIILVRLQLAAIFGIAKVSLKCSNNMQTICSEMLNKLISQGFISTNEEELEVARISRSCIVFNTHNWISFDEFHHCCLRFAVSHPSFNRGMKSFKSTSLIAGHGDGLNKPMPIDIRKISSHCNTNNTNNNTNNNRNTMELSSTKLLPNCYGYFVIVVERGLAMSMHSVMCARSPQDSLLTLPNIVAHRLLFSEKIEMESSNMSVSMPIFGDSIIKTSVLTDKIKNSYAKHVEFIMDCQRNEFADISWNSLLNMSNNSNNNSNITLVRPSIMDNSRMLYVLRTNNNSSSISSSSNLSFHCHIEIVFVEEDMFQRINNEFRFENNICVCSASEELCASLPSPIMSFDMSARKVSQLLSSQTSTSLNSLNSLNSLTSVSVDGTETSADSEDSLSNVRIIVENVRLFLKNHQNTETKTTMTNANIADFIQQLLNRSVAREVIPSNSNVSTDTVTSVFARIDSAMPLAILMQMSCNTNNFVVEYVFEIEEVGETKALFKAFSNANVNGVSRNVTVAYLEAVVQVKLGPKMKLFSTLDIQLRDSGNFSRTVSLPPLVDRPEVFQREIADVISSYTTK